MIGSGDEEAARATSSDDEQEVRSGDGDVEEENAPGSVVVGQGLGSHAWTAEPMHAAASRSRRASGRDVKGPRAGRGLARNAPTVEYVVAHTTCPRSG